MKELQVMNHGKELAIRTAGTIAAEINGIKNQTRQIVLSASIEIGRRLVEAKSLLEHGEWGDWLEEQVSYSSSTANNLMRLFDAYGANQITLLDNNVKSPIYEGLSYSKAVALLGVPDEEREIFTQEHDVNNMSTRELQKAIEERDAAIKRQQQSDIETAEQRDAAQAAEARNRQASIEIESMRKRLANIQKEADAQKVVAVAAAKEDAKKAKAEADALRKRLKDIESKPMAVHSGATDEDIEEAKDAVEREYSERLAKSEAAAELAEKKVQELTAKMSRQSNGAAVKYGVHFELLNKEFGALLGCLVEMEAVDPDLAARHRKATKELVGKMSERVEA